MLLICLPKPLPSPWYHLRILPSYWSRMGITVLSTHWCQLRQAKDEQQPPYSLQCPMINTGAIVRCHSIPLGDSKQTGINKRSCSLHSLAQSTAATVGALTIKLSGTIAHLHQCLYIANSLISFHVCKMLTYFCFVL